MVTRLGMVLSLELQLLNNMIPQGITPEEFMRIVTQATLAVEALVYVEINS